jgi:hypothetical protein
MLHKTRILADTDDGTLYECIFPEWIVRFMIPKNKSPAFKIRAYYWANDHGHRAGPDRCLPPCKFDSFEQLDEVWVKLYAELSIMKQYNSAF